MKQHIQVLMDLILSQVSIQPPDTAAFLALSEEEQNAIVSLAKKHSVAQLLGNALGSQPETARLDVVKPLIRESMLALSHTVKLEQERKKVCSLLCQAQIPYICLKGCRIRPYYPEPWMRTSCDNDILVHEEDLDRAASLLTETLGYTCGDRAYHDISLYSGSGVHLELHFSIKENKPTMDRVLSRVWSYSAPVPSSDGYEYQQSAEFFLFHLIAHMADHFIEGGCGIRPFLDLFLLQEKLPFHNAEVEDLCRQAGLDRFYENTRQLIDVWFRGRPHSPVTRRMEDYLLSGGIYGTRSNQIAVRQNRDNNKFSYLFHRVFASTEHLCGRYPSLRRHRWLTPFYQVRRWYTALCHGKLDELKSDLQLTQSLDQDMISEVEQVLADNQLL